MNAELITETNIAREKRAFRSELKKQIAELDEEYIIDSNKAIYEAFMALPEVLTAECILMYYGIGREIATKAIIDALMSLEKTVALPVCRDNGIMHFGIIRSGELIPGMYGIPEPPDNAEIVEPGQNDVIAVPGIAYDRNGYRIGQGKGYYDRYLSRYKVRSVGMARSRLLCSSVPRNELDMKTDILIADDEIIRLF